MDTWKGYVKSIAEAIGDGWSVRTAEQYRPARLNAPDGSIIRLSPSDWRPGMRVLVSGDCICEGRLADYDRYSRFSSSKSATEAAEHIRRRFLPGWEKYVAEAKARFSEKEFRNG